MEVVVSGVGQKIVVESLRKLSLYSLMYQKNKC